MPSKIKLHMNEARQTTHPQPPSGGGGISSRGTVLVGVLAYFGLVAFSDMKYQKRLEKIKNENLNWISLVETPNRFYTFLLVTNNKLKAKIFLNNFGLSLIRRQKDVETDS